MKPGNGIDGVTAIFNHGPGNRGFAAALSFYLDQLEITR